MLNQKKTLIDKAKYTTELLFMILTGVYLLFLCIYNTNYDFPTIPEFHVLLYIMIGVVLLRVTLSLTERSKQKLISALVISLVFILVYQTGKEHFLLFLPVLTIGMMGIDYKRIVKLYIVAVGAFWVVWVISSFGGLLPNLVYFRDGHLRSSWGMAYPTDFASCLLFLIMMIWVAWDEIPDACISLGAGFSLLISWRIADSRTSVICNVILLAFTAFHYLDEHLDISDVKYRKAVSLIRQVMIFAFPFFFFVTVISVVAYDNGIIAAEKLNDILSGRLYLTSIILKDHGIHPFGSLFYQVGQVNTNGNTLPPAALYFLDSSYSQILIRYGWVLLLLCCTIWVEMSYRAYKNGDYKLLAVLALIAFHSWSEHHFLEVNYNLFLVLPLAVIKNRKKAESIPGSLRELVNNKKPEFFILVGELAGIVLSAPLLLSRMRTVLSVHAVIGGWKDRLLLISKVGLFLLAIGILCFMLCCVAGSVVRKEKIKRKTVAIGLLCLLFLGVVLIHDSHIINDAYKVYENQMELDEKAIQTMVSSADGEVCVEGIPELYRQRFGAINRTVLYGDDLARYRSVSVVTNRSIDRQRFTDCGFKYAAISDEHAVYSNDDSVIKAMEKEGFTWTDYYSEKKVVDLEGIAESNDLELTADKTILLASSNLENGPWVDLYAGKYLVSYDIQTRSPLEGDYPVCTLVVMDYDKARVLEKMEVSRDMFDENGKLNAEFSFYTNGSRNAEFVVYMRKGQSIELSSISFQKTGRSK